MVPWRVAGPPLRRSGVLLGARVPPREAQGRKSWFVGPPRGPRFGSFFDYFCNNLRLKTDQKTHCFFNGFLGGFWLMFWLIFDEFWYDLSVVVFVLFSMWFVSILEALRGSPTLIFAIPSMRNQGF